MASPLETAEEVVGLFHRGLLTEEEAVDRIIAAYSPGGMTRGGALEMLHPDPDGLDLPLSDREDLGPGPDQALDFEDDLPEPYSHLR